MLKAGKLSHLIKELKQSNEKDQAKAAKKEETSGKDKPLAILMVQPWQRVAKQRITQTFYPDSVISFPPLGEEDGTEGPMIIEAEMGGHFVHRMYVDGGSSSEILVTVSIQRDHRKARSKENLSSSVNSSRNAKIPSDRRNGHITEQHDYSTRVHNGLRTRSAATRSALTEEGRKELCGLLRRNLDIFAWKPADMSGIPRHIAKHRLNIREECLPVRQKKRGWLSNTVMVKKHDDSWRMCVDFKDLNKACPKDGYPLPEIDWKKQIGQNLEVYVEDLVIKSCMKQEVIRDMEETFKTLREKNMKLNPKKYAFGMREGTFLGYKVIANKLRVYPDKVEAVLNLPSPKCLKDVQRLNGKLACLNRVLSKSAEKSLPFFKTLIKCTKKSDFQWTAEVKMAFKQMKKLIAELPMLTAPKEKEELIIYLAAAKEAISAVLMTKRGGKQMSIYFLSRALQGAEINYTPMEKLILALILSNPKVTGRLLKWSFELEEHDIHYRPRTSIKGQILSDFIVERPKDDPPDTPMKDKGRASGSMDTVHGRIIMHRRFDATNNEAEYEALIAGLRISEQIGVKILQANVDSRLVANQVNGTYIAKEPGMIKYLEKEILPEEKRKERAIRRKAGRYAMTNGSMYKRSFLEPWLRCVGPLVLLANYARRRQELIRECNSCQVHRPVPRNPQQNLTPITSSWPFYKWGIDIARPFSEGPDKVKFLIVAIDYFTKWIEVKPVVTITGAQIKKFVWDNIVCRFGLPEEIISDNGKQFRDNPFKDWCEKLCIRQCFASVKHRQANGLVEKANRSLGEGIKARLDERSKNWLEEISHVLWAHRTMIKSSNGETSFSLTYGTEAVIPVEIGMPTLRTAEVDMIKNDEALEINLGLLEEKREQAAIQEVKSKAKMEKYYNARVCNTSFKPGDLMMTSNNVYFITSFIPCI
ncbi:reverse transcriptase domain-containing protein [Tanacetum coccineum]